MSNFLEGYEDVNARIIRARAEYPSLRLVASIEDIDITKGYVLIKAEAYREYEDVAPSAVVTAIMHPTIGEVLCILEDLGGHVLRRRRASKKQTP